MEDMETQKMPEAEHSLQMEPPSVVVNQAPKVPEVELNIPSNTQNSPGIIILQWLTYAFWGWTIIALGILLTTVISHILLQSETGDFTPYGIAAVLVLLPISVVCDLFYSKKEPQKKTGAAAIVMVIHAVIFALFGIASLIGFVFSIVSLATSRTETTTTMVSLISTISIAVIYAVTLLRTIKPRQLQWVPKAYTGFMVLVSLIVIILAIVGPVASERLTRNDRLIVENMTTITSSVDGYAKANDKLPEDLSQITINDADAKKIISDKLVEYTPNSKKPTTTTRSYGNRDKTFYYTLCVDYKKSTNASTSSYDNYGTYPQDEYTSYPSTYSHPAGEVCYKISTRDY